MIGAAAAQNRRKGTTVLGLIVAIGLGLGSAPRVGHADAVANELRDVYKGKAADHAYRLVVVAEGYTAAHKAKFFADATATIAGLLQSNPYSFVAPWLEVYGLFVESAEPGADKPSQGVEVSTAFNATFGSFNVDRLLTVDNGKVLSVVASALPSFDVAIALVNDDKYGGSGGPVTVVSLHASSLDILRHELAHTVAQVADEYETPYPGYPVGDSEPNVAASNHLAPLKWAAWIVGDVAIPTPIADATGPFAPIGAYEGARFQSKGMFRPAPSCIMRQLGVGFCPICLEAVVGAIGREVFQITGASPVGTGDVVCGASGCPLFGVAFPPHSAATVTWELDDLIAADGISFRPAPTTLGPHSVRATLNLPTPLLQTPMQSSLRQVRQWTLNVVALPLADAGGSVDAQLNETPDAPAQDATIVDAPEPAPALGCSTSPRRQGRVSLFGAVAIVLSAAFALSTRRRPAMRSAGRTAGRTARRTSGETS